MPMIVRGGMKFGSMGNKLPILRSTGPHSAAAFGCPIHVRVGTVKLGCTRLAVPPNIENAAVDELAETW